MIIINVKDNQHIIHFRFRNNILSEAIFQKGDNHSKDLKIFLDSS